jgi:opacity protein-like surface antigen
MRQLLNIFLVITTFTLGAQNKTHEKLSLNFEYSKHQYAMDSLNKHYLDYYINELEFLDDQIKFGYNVSFGINYRPSSKFDFGIRIGYQYASTQKTIQTEIYGISPQPIETDMLNLVKVNSTNICL